MTYHIYRDRQGFTLESEGVKMERLHSEGVAVEIAVRHAQDNGGCYQIEYWRP